MISVLFLWVMIENEIKNNKLFLEFTPLLKEMGILIVDVKKNVTNNYVNYIFTIGLIEGEITVDECAKVYDLLYPRLTVLEGTRNINLEVTTPGIQRSFRDFYEFSIFKGKRVRLYDKELKNTLTGIISEVFEDSVELTDLYNEDKDERISKITIVFENILKAKLDFKWEDIK